MIVVGIECSDRDLQRVQEYCPYSIESRIYGHIDGKGEETMNWIVNELKPFIDRTYRTWPFREATAIAGYSMGGMMSLYAVLHYNQYFSKAASISPSFLILRILKMKRIFRLPVSRERKPPRRNTENIWLTGMADIR